MTHHRSAAGVLAACAIVAGACTGAAGTVPGTPPPTEGIIAEEIGREVPLPESPDHEAPAAADTGGGSALPDITAAPLDVSRLWTLLPPSVPGNRAGPDWVERGNGDLLAAATPDRGDEAADLTAFGRLTGVAATYEQPDGAAHLWIDVLPDPDSAHGYLQDVAGDVAKGVGILRIGQLVPSAVHDFPIELGDQAIGLVLELQDGRTETAALFRLGRLVIMTSLVRDEADHRVATQYLAEQVADGVVRALTLGTAAAAISPPSEDPGRFGFAFELDVVSATETLTVRTSGVSDGADVACRVQVDGRDIQIDRELRRIGTAAWGRPWGRDWEPVGRGNLLDAMLLSWCPAWPLDLETAGLEAIRGNDAAEMTSGEFGRLLGYRGDEAMLAEALGTPLLGVTVEVMNAWLTADAGTLVEFNLRASGPAPSLAPLVGAWPLPDTEVIRLDLHHRVTAIDDVAPIRPPS